MKVYLSVPMITNRALDRAKVMAKAVQDSGHVVSSPWVLGNLEPIGKNSPNIFQRDLIGAETSDAILADVTEPSVGVGMEIMAAYKAKKRVIVLMKRGRPTSRMLLQMDGLEIVPYESESEVYSAVLGALRKDAKP